MRLRSLLVLALSLPLCGCVVAPAPGYYEPAPAPAYYPAYPTANYYYGGPEVVVGGYGAPHYRGYYRGWR